MPQPLDLLLPLMSLVVGVFGGVIGAYVGMKVGIARLEEWKDAAKDAIDEAKKDIRRHSDDLLVHDVEIGDLMGRAGMTRVRRQRILLD